MRFFELMVLAALLFLISSCAAVPVESPVAGRIIKSFDSDWRFFKGDAEGAEEPSFNDDSWRRLNVPHDWSIEGPVDRDNPTGRGGAFMPSGIGWYRKHFTLPAEYKARRKTVLEYLSTVSRPGRRGHGARCRSRRGHHEISVARTRAWQWHRIHPREPPNG